MARILFGVTVPITAQAFLIPEMAALVSDDWDVHLACSPDSGFVDLCRVQGITVHSIPMRRNPSFIRDLVSLYRWHRLVRKLRPDIIVGSTPKAALLAMLTGKWNKTRVRIYHARGFRAEGLQGMMKNFAILAERMTIQTATEILCDSNSLRDVLVAKRLLNQGRGVVLGAGSCCGVDTNYFRPPSQVERTGARDRLNVDAGDFVVGFVGRVTLDKGVGELIQAVSTGDKFDRNVRLILVGQKEGEVGGLAEACSEGFVTFLGATSDVRSAYWAFDAFALPSYREGFPIAPLEAQACGLPLITTKVTGCIDSQAPANSQLTVAPRNPAAIANAIRFLANNPEIRSSMGSEAREWVTTNYSSPEVVQQHVNFLKEQVSQ